MCSIQISVSVAANGGPRAALVIVEKVMERELAPQVMLPGTVISRNDSKIPAEVEGRLTFVSEVGTKVTRGDQIALLDNTFAQQEVLERSATVERSRARLTFFNKEVKRLQRLAKNSNAAQSQLDQAISDQSVTKSDLIAARAKLQQAKEKLDRTTIKAPFAGIITERYLKPGEWAENGEAVLRLIDTSAAEIQARIPSEYLAFISSGMRLSLIGRYTNDEGVIRTIVPVGDDLSKLIELRISPSASHWTVGNTLRVAIPTDKKRQVVTVPRDALVLRRDGIYVFRVKEDNTAERVKVKTGTASGKYIEVSNGIHADDRVVIRGGERLRPGQKVMIKPAGKQ